MAPTRFDFDTERDEGVATERKRRPKRPRRWRVVLHNDDYTTMEFVVHVLLHHFHKPPAEAMHVMLEVHHKGSGVAGVYPKDVAETKVAEVMDEARENEMPLRVTAEPERPGADGDEEGPEP